MKKISHIQITFDSGFQRQLTLTASESHNSKIIRAPEARIYEIRCYA